MKRTLSYYVVSEILPPFFLGLMAFTFILLTGRMLKLVELLVTRGVPLSQIGKLFVLILPTFLEMTVPMALLLGILVGLSGLSNDHEILALKASGISPFQILWPIAMVALFVSLLTLLITTLVRPAANLELKKELYNIAKSRVATGRPICGDDPTITELIDYEAFCGVAPSPASQEQGPEITAENLAEEVKSQPDLLIIDVREPHEWEIGHINGATLVPLGQLPQRVGDLDGRRKIVTYCHHGLRSMQALEILTAAGYDDVRSLRGGIDAWSTQIDSSVPRY